MVVVEEHRTYSTSHMEGSIHVLHNPKWFGSINSSFCSSFLAVAKKPTQDVQTLPTVQETAEDEGSASTTAKKSIALGVPTIAPPTTAPMPAAPVTAVPVVVEVVAAYA